jgi:hypothetical protein
VGVLDLPSEHDSSHQQHASLPLCRFTQALQQTGVAAAAGAGAGGSSAGPANDFARSLPVMPRKSRASPALSKSRKRKSSVASDKDSDSEAESADVMTMLVSQSSNQVW